MGKRGPQKKPTVMRIIEGNPSKRPVPEPGVVILEGEPFVPPHLSDDAQECVEMIKRMMPPKLYGEVDGFALSAYATAYAWHKYFSHAMSAPDFQTMVVGSTGALRPHPYFKLLKDQSGEMRAWGTRLGLDPAARAALIGLAPAAPEKPPSKFDGLIKTKNARRAKG